MARVDAQGMKRLMELSQTDDIRKAACALEFCEDERFTERVHKPVEKAE